MATMTFTTTVLPGGQIHITAPQLAEGQTVTVTVAEQAPATKPPPDRKGILDLILSFRPSGRTPEEWEQFEREFQEERNSRDR
jgi:hypothetical protein